MYISPDEPDQLFVCNILKYLKRISLPVSSHCRAKASPIYTFMRFIPLFLYRMHLVEIRFWVDYAY